MTQYVTTLRMVALQLQYGDLAEKEMIF